MKKSVLNYVVDVCNLKRVREYSRGMRFDVIGVECEGGVSVEVGESKSSYVIRIEREGNIMRYKLSKGDENLNFYLEKNK